MSYPRTDCTKKTDESFRNRTDPDHHKELTTIEILPIDLIQDFIIADALHLLDLGIAMKCLTGWVFGSFNFKTKWRATKISEVSDILISCNETLPTEIHRAVRRLDCVRFWKGLEFRTFLLYIGIVVLKDNLLDAAYEHFLLLFCAVTLCSSNEYIQYLNIAERLFLDYIQGYIRIYGKDSIGSNVHNLCHVVDDVRKFGPLPTISAYAFENHLGYIKRLLRNGNRPLSQIAKRLTELSLSWKEDVTRVHKYPITKIKEHEKKSSYKKLQFCMVMHYHKKTVSHLMVNLTFMEIA